MKGFVRHLHKINKGKRKAISEHMLMFEARKFGLKLDLRYIGDGGTPVVPAIRVTEPSFRGQGQGVTYGSEG